MALIGNQITRGDFPVDVFAGNGSTTTFTLSRNPGVASAIDVYISGVKQAVATYGISGTSLIFSSPPPSPATGVTYNIEVVYKGVMLDIGTPSDNTVVTSKLVDGAVTGRKIATSDVTTLSALMDAIGRPVGSYVEVQIDLVGANEPASSNFIRLKSGLTGTGNYNYGKFSSETVSGSSPTINATAVINDPTSPLNGQTVHLLEDEGRFLRAGGPGTLQESQNLLHNHAITDNGHIHSTTANGGLVGGGSGSSANLTSGGGSFITTSIASATTGITIQNSGGTEARPRNIGVAVYMRYK